MHVQAKQWQYTLAFRGELSTASMPDAVRCIERAKHAVPGLVLVAAGTRQAGSATGHAIIHRLPVRAIGSARGR